MENSERAEFQIGGDTVFYRNDSTIQVIVTGIQTLEMALEMKRLCLQLSPKTGAKYDFLIPGRCNQKFITPAKHPSD